LSEQPRYPRINRTIYKAGRAIFRFIYDIVARRHVTGLENLPQSGPYIMVSNHMSYVDSPLIYIELPAFITVLAAEKYEHHPFRPILNLAGPIFINRGEVDRVALRQVLAVLEDGGVLGIAIEGTRSRTGGLGKGKSGAAYFATRANVPIVPVVMYGTEKVLSNLRRLRRTDLYTVIGPPIHLPPGRARTEELDAYTEQIMVAMAAMLPEQYRGFYADHPLLKERLSNPVA
jgi:1-acyl-sn-glycerol-3-phosphate acyltransferase